MPDHSQLRVRILSVLDGADDKGFNIESLAKSLQTDVRLVREQLEVLEQQGQTFHLRDGGENLWNLTSEAKRTLAELPLAGEPEPDRMEHAVPLDDVDPSVARADRTQQVRELMERMTALLLDNTYASTNAWVRSVGADISLVYVARKLLEEQDFVEITDAGPKLLKPFRAAEAPQFVIPIEPWSSSTQVKLLSKRSVGHEGRHPGSAMHKNSRMRQNESQILLTLRAHPQGIRTAEVARRVGNKTTTGMVLKILKEHPDEFKQIGSMTRQGGLYAVRGEVFVPEPEPIAPVAEPEPTPAPPVTADPIPAPPSRDESVQAVQEGFLQYRARMEQALGAEIAKRVDVEAQLAESVAARQEGIELLDQMQGQFEQMSVQVSDLQAEAASLREESVGTARATARIAELEDQLAQANAQTPVGLSLRAAHSALDQWATHLSMVHYSDDGPVIDKIQTIRNEVEERLAVAFVRDFVAPEQPAPETVTLTWSTTKIGRRTVSVCGLDGDLVHDRDKHIEWHQTRAIAASAQDNAEGRHRS